MSLRSSTVFLVNVLNKVTGSYDSQVKKDTVNAFRQVRKIFYISIISVNLTPTWLQSLIVKAQHVPGPQGQIMQFTTRFNNKQNCELLVVARHNPPAIVNRMQTVGTALNSIDRTYNKVCRALHHAVVSAIMFALTTGLTLTSDGPTSFWDPESIRERT